MRRGKAAVQLLGKGDGKQRISEIDHDLCQHHFNQCTAGGDDADTGNLTGRGQIGNRNAYCRCNRQAKIDAQNTKTKGHRKISQKDWNTVPDALEKQLFHGTIAPYLNFFAIIPDFALKCYKRKEKL